MDTESISMERLRCRGRLERGVSERETACYAAVVMASVERAHSTDWR